ncbi:hypothetical protein [Rhodococcus oryzae]|uniref:hypothetical protein n=1 Tax=Rhodococcus oryzae TaxID=2571143 RepID=UPI0037B4BF7D
MTTAEVWTATGRLADQWRKSALVKQFTQQLPTNNTATGGIPEMLLSIDAGTGFVSEQPLIPNSWEGLAQQLPFVSLDVAGLQFLRAAQPIGFAAEAGTAWLRSRLPGYPMILAPQLAANSHRTTAEMGRGLGWRREAIQGGLQFESAPRGVSQLLSIDANAYNDAMRAVADALTQTAEWRTFASMTERLCKEDRRELTDARRRLRPLLSDETVNAHEPDRMVRRDDYRRTTVSNVTSQLSDFAREFAESFDRVDSLIDLVSLRVLGQLVAYGAPVEVADVQDVERERGVVRFRADSRVPRSALIRLEDPLSPDAALIVSSSHYHDERDNFVNEYQAEILHGSTGLFVLEPIS